jgi:7-cyano-7-deazaguanine synthase in queuosine biosynthesis
MDSFFCWSLFYPDADNVYVDIGHKYRDKELAALSSIQRATPGFRYRVLSGATIGQYEHESGIIPFRNAEMIVTAAQVGERIVLGVLKDEINSDKSEEFFSGIANVLNVCYRKQYWTEGKVFEVVSPLRSFSKTELVAQYLSRNLPAGPLLQTVSCYSAQDGHCGECPSCFKRWVALRLNGIEQDFRGDVVQWAHRTGIVAKARSGQYQPQRSAEIIKAVKL